MRQVVREQVTVDVARSEAWDHLAKLEDWPSWAGHIRRMHPEPPGELTAGTEAVTVHMRAGPATRMAVTDYEPPERWVWEGSSYGTTTRFEHRLDEIDPDTTRIWFLAWMGGPLGGIGGWVFGKMMHRYLTEALPRLKVEMEAGV